MSAVTAVDWTAPAEVADLLRDTATFYAPSTNRDERGRPAADYVPAGSGPALLTGAYQLPYERQIALKTTSEVSHFLFVGIDAVVEPDYQAEVASLTGVRFVVVGAPDLTGQADPAYRADWTPPVRTVLLLRVR